MECKVGQLTLMVKIVIEKAVVPRLALKDIATA